MILGADFQWESAIYEFYQFDNLIEILERDPTFNKSYKV